MGHKPGSAFASEEEWAAKLVMHKHLLCAQTERINYNNIVAKSMLHVNQEKKNATHFINMWNIRQFFDH